jgi:hypothetical protein
MLAKLILEGVFEDAKPYTGSELAGSRITSRSRAEEAAPRVSIFSQTYSAGSFDKVIVA